MTKPETDKKTVRLVCNTTDAIAEAIRSAAKADRLSVSNWIERLAVAELRRVAMLPIEADLEKAKGQTPAPQAPETTPAKPGSLSDEFAKRTGRKPLPPPANLSS